MSRTDRVGATLVELVVVLGLGGVVAAAAARVLQRQQRFFAAAAVVVEQRIHLRDASTILPSELRALAPAAGDVMTFSDSAIDVRATVGTAIACDTVAGGLAIDLAPERAELGVTLTAFASSPEPEDIALIYDEGSADTSADDRWVERIIAGAAWPADACAASPIAAGSDTRAPRLRLALDEASPLPPTVRAGAFVRVLRRVKYRFYRASSGDWYLGYLTLGGSTPGAVQPVSGPFAPYSRDGRSGIALRYFDAAGGEIVAGGAAANIARIHVTARGRPRLAIGALDGAVTDSTFLSVAIRNK